MKIVKYFAAMSLLVSCFMSVVVSPAIGQVVFDDCGDPLCEVDQINISTGYDHLNSALYAPVAADAWWTLIGAPNPDLVVPSPPFVITPNGAWSNLPGARWISAYSTSSLNENNPSPEPPYVFERCFCVCEDVQLRILFDLLIDNVGDVFLDGALIASQTNPGLSSFQMPLSVDVQVPVTAGKHCIRVELRNLSGTAMGFALEGTIQTVPPGQPLMISPLCCDKLGKLIVRKLQDIDCNGIGDSPEVPLSGWTFTLQPGGHTAVTDAAGYAYFTVAAGAYTLTETAKFGWTPGTPASGSMPVTIETGTVKITEFLNCPILGSIAVYKLADLNCDGINTENAYVPGWTFVMNPGGYSGVTDANGCTVFTAPAGNYTVTEIGKPGWEPKDPLSGSVPVTIEAALTLKTYFLNCPPWIDLKGPTSGTFGPPMLVGYGDIESSSSGGFDLVDAPPLNPGIFAVSFGPFLSVPLYCGTLQAFPLHLTFVVITDATGSISIPFVWPPSLPSGLTIVVQVLIPDPGAVCGLAMSNAIRATLP